MGPFLRGRHEANCGQWPAVSVARGVTCDCGAIEWQIGRRGRVYRRFSQLPRGDRIRGNVERIVLRLKNRILKRNGTDEAS